MIDARITGLLVLAWAGLGFAQVKPPPVEVERAVWKIVDTDPCCEGVGGTASLIREDGYFLTAAHVVLKYVTDENATSEPKNTLMIYPPELINPGGEIKGRKIEVVERLCRTVDADGICSNGIDLAIVRLGDGEPPPKISALDVFLGSNASTYRHLGDALAWGGDETIGYYRGTMFTRVPKSEVLHPSLQSYMSYSLGGSKTTYVPYYKDTALSAISGDSGGAVFETFKLADPAESINMQVGVISWCKPPDKRPTAMVESPLAKLMLANLPPTPKASALVSRLPKMSDTELRAETSKLSSIDLFYLIGELKKDGWKPLAGVTATNIGVLLDVAGRRQMSREVLALYDHKPNLLQSALASGEDHRVMTIANAQFNEAAFLTEGGGDATGLYAQSAELLGMIKQKDLVAAATWTRAVALSRSSQFEEAIAGFGTAEYLLPNEARVRAGYAEVLAEVGRNSEAKAKMFEAAERAPSSASKELYRTRAGLFE